MPEYSRQAEALLESFRQFSLPYDPDIVAETMRDQDQHALADLIDSLHDQVNELKVKLRRAERKLAKRRKDKK